MELDEVDVDELEKLIDGHAAALELFAKQWTDATPDVVQMAFIKLARSKPKPDHPVQWLFRVVRNEAISAARSELRRKRHESSRAEDAASWFVASIDDHLDAVAASEALAALPAENRHVIVARLWGGLSFSEIADVLEISVSAAHRNYHCGLIILRERLGVVWLKNES